jgi:predicted RNA-binding Zn-ribbon protein involved in translation (DUF1610 family)
VSANVRCAGYPHPAFPGGLAGPCGWEGDAEAAATGRTHIEHHTTVHEYRCPRCGGEVELIHKEEAAANGAA